MADQRNWCHLTLSRGEKAKVDREDMDRLSQHKWRIITKESGRRKVVTNIKTEKGYRQVSLGHFLMNPPEGKMVYPRRFVEGLDYRKSNLIVCTMQERQQMLPKTRKSDKSSQYKGVYFLPKTKRWRAGIKVEGKTKSLGVFSTEEEAALAYNEAARQFFGEMTYQNRIVVNKKREGDES